jgi:DNA recombination protein RmuC
VKAQGAWGEVILEKILEESGLRKDKDYTLQGTDMGLRHAEHGGVLKPDVIINLPEDKHVIVDAKVSLTSYERYCAAENDAERALHLKDFLLSLRNHVGGLEKRRYQDTDKLGTPDFVLMFLPIEGAYSLAVQEDPTLHSYAWDKKIVIVCPATLFATLRTIASVWRIELQNRNAQEIARQGGNLYDKIVSFVEDLQKLGDRINAARDSYEDAFKKLSTGQGNILKRAENLRALGLKTSKKLTVDADDDETPPQIARNS